MAGEQDLLRTLYRNFNERNIDAVLAHLHPEVVWPNKWEGGTVHGREGVRDYWTRQWAVLDPRVEPESISTDDAGRFVVQVHQVVRDRDGNLIDDRMVTHVYLFRDGLIDRMDVE